MADINIQEEAAAECEIEYGQEDEEWDIATAEAELKPRQEEDGWGEGEQQKDVQFDPNYKEPPIGITLSGKLGYRDPWSNDYSTEFVQKYRMQLIKKVADPDPLFDLLLHQKVLSDYSYSVIKALPTDEKKMSKLLMGPYLETKPACDIFYDFLKKQQPYLVIDLLQK